MSKFIYTDGVSIIVTYIYVLHSWNFKAHASHSSNHNNPIPHQCHLLSYIFGSYDSSGQSQAIQPDIGLNSTFYNYFNSSTIELINLLLLPFDFKITYTKIFRNLQDHSTHLPTYRVSRGISCEILAQHIGLKIIRKRSFCQI